MVGKMRVFALLVEESGQDIIEYGLLLGLLGLAAIASLRALTGGIGTLFSSVGSTLTAAS